MLAELVAEGKLPPVEERLPEQPGICPVQEMNGKYGGIMRRGYTGVSDRTGPTKMQECSLTWFNPDLTMRTEMAESWAINEDASEWTFKLRPGTKWSDGTPFTSAAFTWFWENEMKNEELTASPPRNWATGNPLVLGELEAPDDFTVVFKFADPNPLFVYRPSRGQPFVPGHYLEQFHADFVDKDALDKMVKEAGVNAWTELYAQKATWNLNPERPSTSPWTAENRLGDELFMMVRNLLGRPTRTASEPYIDKIQHRLYEQTDVFNMWIINGEIDFQRRQVAIGNYTLFKENEKKGGATRSTCRREASQALHEHDHQDQRLRTLFQERQFRIAVSYAINREKMNDLIYDGMCTPRQYSWTRATPEYYPSSPEAYLEYSPDKANAILDELELYRAGRRGLPQVQRRLREIISFIFEHHADDRSRGGCHALMVSADLAAVGIKATYKP